MRIRNERTAREFIDRWERDVPGAHESLAHIFTTAAVRARELAGVSADPRDANAAAAVLTWAAARQRRERGR